MPPALKFSSPDVLFRHRFAALELLDVPPPAQYHTFVSQTDATAIPDIKVARATLAGEQDWLQRARVLAAL